MAQSSAEKLEHTWPAEKERVASVPQRESSWQERQSHPCQKEKEQSCQSRTPDHEGRESRTLVRDRGIRTRAWREKGGLHDERTKADSKEEWEGKQEESP